MESKDNVHRLEGSSNEKGGLILKKKPPTFKVPQPSLLGLDRLAAKKRKEKEEAARKMSFTLEEDESNEESGLSLKENKERDARKFRSPQEETPTYTGGITKEARDRLIERLTRNKEKGVYATTKNKQDHESSESRNSHRKRRKEKEREKDRDRFSQRDKYKKSERESERGDKTPRFRDEPKTPDIRVKDSTSKTSWDEEDEPVPIKKSAWDFPTPSVYRSKGGEWSERSNKSYNKSERSYRDDRRSSRDRHYKMEDDTPRPTPAHRYNTWMKDRKRTGATPGLSKDEALKWDSTVDRENWEEEQKRLDREWYNMDEGYDDENNPFSSVSDEYTKKKEEQLEQRKKKRLSAQQRQINKDNELWERNRMLTSGLFMIYYTLIET